MKKSIPIPATAPLKTIKEMAQSLNVCRGSLYKWSRLGIIPSIKVGSALRFIEPEVRDAILTRRKVSGVIHPPVK
jgi:excisionase family DNA binding protein